MKRKISLTGALLAALLVHGCSKGSNEKDTQGSASTSGNKKIMESSSISSSSISSQNGNAAAGVTLRSIELSIPVSELSENNETSLTLKGIYSDGKQRALSSNITWQISDTNVLEVKGMKLVSKAEGTATLRAEVNGKLSPPITITVYKVIHGHRLPPEPDPKINNSTLLGIDSNNNGVRDDVERWIYTHYDTYLPCKEVEVNVTIPATGEMVTGFKDICEKERKPYHQIVREIAMQGARAAQIIIQEPEKARETMKYMDAAVDCNGYFSVTAKYRNKPLLIDGFIFGNEFNEIQFNTTMRARAYAKYNMALSGGVYGGRTIDEQLESCDFNATKLLEKQ